MKAKLLSVLLLVLGFGLLASTTVVVTGCGEAAESSEDDD